MDANKNKDQDKLTPVPLAIMTGQGNVFQAIIIDKDWAEEVKSYNIRGIPLEVVEEFFADKVSIAAQLFNLSNEEQRAVQNKWLPLVVSKDRKGLTLDDLKRDGWDTKNLRELWRAVLDLSGF